MIHSTLIEKINYPNPYGSKIKNLKKLLNMGKVSCFDMIIDVKREV